MLRIVINWCYLKKMSRSTVVIILACYLLAYCKCDNRNNDRYNRLINQYNLKKSISTTMPKESKFFDINDFDCKYFTLIFFSCNFIFSI